MKLNRAWGASLLVSLSCALAVPAAHAVSLNNTVMVQGSMTWMQDLSAVDSPNATDVVYMENMDGTYTYMGNDSIVMMSDPVWDYSWALLADTDPFIAGTFMVTNTSTTAQTFDITFSLPISPAFTNGLMTGSLSASFFDLDNSGEASLVLNDWDGLIDGTSQMSLFAFAGPCFGVGCSVDIAEITQGPTFYGGDVNSTIGIHMNFTLSSGDSVTFDTRFEVNPVPLPAAVWLFGAGLLGLIGIARRKSA